MNPSGSLGGCGESKWRKPGFHRGPGTWLCRVYLGAPLPHPLILHTPNIVPWVCNGCEDSLLGGALDDLSVLPDNLNFLRVQVLRSVLKSFGGVPEFRGLFLEGSLYSQGCSIVRSTWLPFIYERVTCRNA